MTINQCCACLELWSLYNYVLQHRSYACRPIKSGFVVGNAVDLGKWSVSNHMEAWHITCSWGYIDVHSTTFDNWFFFLHHWYWIFGWILCLIIIFCFKCVHFIVFLIKLESFNAVTRLFHTFGLSLLTSVLVFKILPPNTTINGPLAVSLPVRRKL